MAGNYTLLLDVNGKGRMRLQIVGDKIMLDEWPRPVDGSYAQNWSVIDEVIDNAGVSTLDLNVSAREQFYF